MSSGIEIPVIKWYKNEQVQIMKSSDRLPKRWKIYIAMVILLKHGLYNI